MNSMTRQKDNTREDEPAGRKGVQYATGEACMSIVAQPCLTLGDPMDCSLPGSSVCRIFQARILEQVAISFSSGSSQPRDGTLISCISCIGRWILYHCGPWESPCVEGNY